VVVGISTYVGAELERFREKGDCPSRVVRLSCSPCFIERHPGFLGRPEESSWLLYVIASAAPSTLGAHAGPFSLPFAMLNRAPSHQAVPVDPISRSPARIAVGTGVVCCSPE